MYLLVRLAFLTVFAMTQNYLMGCFFEAMLLTLTAILVGVVQPYKSHVHNVVDMVLILAVALFYSSIAINRVADIEYLSYNIPTAVLMIIFILVPLFYISTVALYWLLLRKKFHKSCAQNSETCYLVSVVGQLITAAQRNHCQTAWPILKNMNHYSKGLWAMFWMISNIAPDLQSNY